MFLPCPVSLSPPTPSQQEKAQWHSLLGGGLLCYLVCRSRKPSFCDLSPSQEASHFLCMGRSEVSSLDRKVRYLRGYSSLTLRILGKCTSKEEEVIFVGWEDKSTVLRPGESHSAHGVWNILFFVAWSASENLIAPRA